MRTDDEDAALLEAELICAALRYAAVADWFENRPTARRERLRDGAAMDVFNRVEEELRTAGGRLLRRYGHRDVVLAQALAEVATTGR